MNVAGPLLLALFTAVGNGFFAYAQRRAIGVENNFVFIIITLSICVAGCMLTAPLFGSVNYVNTIKQNIGWSALSGLGLYMTYIGFNLLYTNYGAASYILYAVLSIITTTVIVGAVLLREQLNLYHWLAVLSALLTVGLFSYGNSLRVP